MALTQCDGLLVVVFEEALVEEGLPAYEGLKLVHLEWVSARLSTELVTGDHTQETWQ